MSHLRTLGTLYEMNDLDTEKYLILLRDKAYDLVTKLNKTKVYTKEELELIEKIEQERVKKDKIDIIYNNPIQKKMALIKEVGNRLVDVRRLCEIDLKHASEDHNRIIEQISRENAEAQAIFEKNNPAKARKYGPIQSGVLKNGKAVWRTKTRSRKSRKPKTRKNRTV
jgi:hypothetical protein